MILFFFRMPAVNYFRFLSPFCKCLQGQTICNITIIIACRTNRKRTIWQIENTHTHTHTQRWVYYLPWPSTQTAQLHVIGGFATASKPCMHFWLQTPSIACTDPKEYVLASVTTIFVWFSTSVLTSIHENEWNRCQMFVWRWDQMLAVCLKMKQAWKVDLISSNAG